MNHEWDDIMGKYKLITEVINKFISYLIWYYSSLSRQCLEVDDNVFTSALAKSDQIRYVVCPWQQ